MSSVSSSLPSVYIDGQSGTVGLRIRAMLETRTDLRIVEIDPARRRDPEARRQMLQSADIAILCLPDDAAREAVALIGDSGTRVIDGSTAHRVSEGWTYGLPELTPDQRKAVAEARLVSCPGCWPTGISLLLRPLTDAGLLPKTQPVSIHGLSGYTGGGKALVERWESPGSGLIGLPYEAPYALNKGHKHIPEMLRYGGLTETPQFVPAVGPFPCGMRIEIPLHNALLPTGTDGKSVLAAYRARYTQERAIVVRDADAILDAGEAGLDPRRCVGTNRVELAALPHPDGHLLLVALLDNLGKGASGAAVQNLNLMLGLDEFAGLQLS